MSRLCDSNRAAAVFGKSDRVVRWLTLLIFTFALSARGQEQSSDSISREVKQLFDRCARSVVKIHGRDEHSDLSGTGFFVDPTGTIYTAYSVGGEATNFSVEFGGKKFPARQIDRKSTRLNSSHVSISYAVFCLKKKKNINQKFLKS